MSIRCVLLTTDTKHHRFLAKKLAAKAEVTVILQRGRFRRREMYWKHVRQRKSPLALVDNPYFPAAYAQFEAAQNEFENNCFAESVDSDWGRLGGLYEFDDLNHSECVAFLKSVEPDLLVSFGTGVLQRAIVTLQTLKINIHRGILPKYRGLDSDLWAFYFRDFENVGTTVHKLSPLLDAGDILLLRKLRIRPGMKVHQMRYYTTFLATEMVEDIVDSVENGDNLDGTPQDLSKGKYYTFIPPVRRLLASRRFNEYVRSLR